MPPEPIQHDAPPRQRAAAHDRERTPQRGYCRAGVPVSPMLAIHSATRAGQLFTG